jgi:hypothetical protein
LLLSGFTIDAVPDMGGVRVCDPGRWLNELALCGLNQPRDSDPIVSAATQTIQFQLSSSRPLWARR